MTMLTVFSKPDCVQCDRTYAFLERKQIPFHSVDVTVDAAALAKVQEMGYQAAPVVIAPNGEHWFGFRPDLLGQFVPQAASL